MQSEKTPFCVNIDPPHKMYALLRSLGCVAETKMRMLGPGAQLSCWTDLAGEAVITQLRNTVARTGVDVWTVGRYFVKHPELLVQLIAAHRLGAPEEVLYEIVKPLQDIR